MKAKKLVSVIISTKNEAENIENCLASIIDQKYDEIEIVVVDNNSTDNTKELAKKYTKLVYNFGPERSSQRNFGANHAKGEYLLFLDADMKLDSQVISECVKKAVESGCGSIIIPEESYGIGFWASCKKLERSYYQGNDDIESPRFFQSKIFNDAKGFDEEMISGEDWDLSQRVKKNNIARIKRLIYHNEGKISLFHTVKKKYYYSTKFNVYLKKNHGTINSDKRINIASRYILFFSDYRKIIKNPIIFFGMLFMKTCEFAAGFAGLYL